jgi:NTP pyrophosphatase (non-canonical NTP hydrolase)
MNYADVFTTKAEQNIVKWGLQDYETLGLAIAEEAGELAQAILQYRHEEGFEERICDEAADLGALCVQMLKRYDLERLSK